MANKKQAQKGGKSTKTTSKQNEHQKKERGIALTIVLVLILVHGVLASLLTYSSLKAGDEYSKTLMVAALVAFTLADIVAAIGMWFWKKWAIYLYAVASIGAMAVHLMMTGNVWIAFHDIIPLAILGYVINLQSKRNLFE